MPMRLSTIAPASSLDGLGSGVLYFLIIAVAIVAIVWSFIAAAKRRQELSAFALQNGFSFEASPGNLHDQYEAFVPFDQGHSRRSNNWIHGRRGTIDWEMFDYKYTTGSGKNQQTHHYGIVLAKINLALSKMRIRPEGFFDKLAGMVGFDDIDFESEEFSKRYYVSSTDRKFAYDLIHPKMMEYLMAQAPSDWQLGGRIVMIIQSRNFRVDELHGKMMLIEGFVRLIPEYVRQDRGSV